MSNVFVVNSFADVKLKSSGGGGFSDGGVISQSVALKEAGGAPVTVEIAPPKGVNLGGVTMDSPDTQGEPGGVTGFNFDTVNPVDVEEYFVSADGTETLIFRFTPINPQTYDNVTDFFENGGILSYPNKLRYKLAQTQGKVLSPLPTARVLLKYALVLYDRPSDQG
jgi:hypothetical protein